MREFKTGATRDSDQGKLNYEGFMHPLVVKRFAQYMHMHRQQDDGSMRDGDNWQRGMPLDCYMDSGMRHFMDWWLHHRGCGKEATEEVEEALCALIFNVQGYLHAILMGRDSRFEEHPVFGALDPPTQADSQAQVTAPEPLAYGERPVILESNQDSGFQQATPADSGGHQRKTQP